MALIPERCESYPARISTPPAHFTRLLEGEELRLGESDWTIWIGRGHSPEHACLYNAAHNVIISGDQLLPKISPNVAIWPTEPTADPLQLFLQSLHLFYDVDPSCLVLPSHDHPFYGAAQRAQVLARHHQERLEETLALCGRAKTALEVLKGLFPRPLDPHQVFFAMGETLAHLHHLHRQGQVKRTISEEHVWLFQSA